MRTFRAVLAFTLVLGTVATGSAAAPTANERATYIVVLDDSVSDVAAEARQMVNAHRGELGFVYEHALKGFSAELSAQAASAIARSPRVVAVNADRPVHMTAETVPTGVSRIDAPKAHAAATGAGIRVAIIDTGIDLDHPDLKANIDAANARDCINAEGNADDDQGHGTHVAGTVAAIGGNGIGVVGVAPGATLIPVKVLDSAGNGTWATVICGIDHVEKLGNVDVANMSLGGAGSAKGTCTTPGLDDALHLAICKAIAAGVTFVVAAGNDGKDASNFVPAAYPEVITVSAYSDRDGTKADIGCSGGGPFRTCDETFASFSNFGKVVDVIAPGVNINSTTMGGGYGTKSGTSMAAPHAAGVAALVLQQARNQDPPQELTPSDVEAHLRNTGQCPKDGKQNGGTTGVCIDQGTWKNDKDAITEPMVNALFAIGSAPGDGGGGDGTTNAPPTASFSHSCTDLTCNFNGTGSSDSDGEISSYAWDFGDGKTGSGVEPPSITYSAAGTYTVTLTVTDNEGATGTSSQNVSVGTSLTGRSESTGSSWTAIAIYTGPPGTYTGTWENDTTGSCMIESGTSCSISRTGIPKRVSAVKFTDSGSLGVVTINKP